MQITAHATLEPFARLRTFRGPAVDNPGAVDKPISVSFFLAAEKTADIGAA